MNELTQRFPGATIRDLPGLGTWAAIVATMALTARSLTAQEPAASGAATSETPGTAAAAEVTPPPQDDVPQPLTPESQALAEELRQKLPEGSEARLMLEDIATGKSMGPGDGWFAVSHGQSRFSWETVQGQFDANHDGVIARDEFPGNDDQFAVIDRNQSNSIEEKDLDWSEHALVRSPVTQLFYKADADSNGHISPEEFSALFVAMDREQAGMLCLDDLKDALIPRSNGSAGPSDEPTPEILLKGLESQEVGAWNAGPAVGDTAPDFTLRAVDGTEVVLHEQYGEKPLVLIFGNFTCGPFRAHSGNVERVFRRYGDQANFVMVYVREAHPTDGWRMTSNDTRGVSLSQPKTDEERSAVAARCATHLEAPWMMLVDHVDDAVGRAYSGMPSRLYVIDRDGQIVYKSGRGPFGFKPAEMEQSLVWLLSGGSVAKPSLEPPAP